jgi:hypothetical protein
MVAGVTSILKRLAKEALLPWAASMASEYFKNCLLSGYDETNPEASVTYTVAEINAIANDARKAYAKKAKAAANIGKLVHSYAEAVLKGNKDPDRPRCALSPEDWTRYENGVYAFQKWWRENDMEVLASERVIFSQRWMYAGTTDFVARIKGRKVVGDFKTSTGLYPEAALQTAAYSIAIEEEDGEVCHDRLLVRFDKMTGQVFTMNLPRSREHEEAFLALRECDELMKRIERNWRVI